MPLSAASAELARAITPVRPTKQSGWGGKFAIFSLAVRRITDLARSGAATVRPTARVPNSAGVATDRTDALDAASCLRAMPTARGNDWPFSASSS